MTDERIGDRLWQAIAALPERSGVVFRHHATPERERRRLGRELGEECRRRGLVLTVARSVSLATELGAALVHNPDENTDVLPMSRSAHSIEEARAACEAGAALLFLSPIFPTRSHLGAEPLARDEARQISASCPVPVIALGGMNRARFAGLQGDGFYGWAGIDAWLPSAAEDGR